MTLQALVQEGATHFVAVPSVLRRMLPALRSLLLPPKPGASGHLASRTVSHPAGAPAHTSSTHPSSLGSPDLHRFPSTQGSDVGAQAQGGACQGSVAREDGGGVQAGGPKRARRGPSPPRASASPPCASRPALPELLRADCASADEGRQTGCRLRQVCWQAGHGYSAERAPGALCNASISLLGRAHMLCLLQRTVRAFCTMCAMPVH